MHIPAPRQSTPEPISRVLTAAQAVFNHSPLDKCLVYAPDAVGLHLFTDHPRFFDELAARATLGVDLHAVFPPKTPVCFASMFTGAMPEVHGIRSYERPVLTCDTLFDALIRSGRSPAIIAPRGASVELIFRQRPMAYFTEQDDQAVTRRALELLASSTHDFILVYHAEYDDLLHLTTPYSAEALLAAEHHVASFRRLANAIDMHWARYRRAIHFAPDHGAHIDPATARGVHGEDIPDDMRVRHYFRFAGSLRSVETSAV